MFCCTIFFYRNYWIKESLLNIVWITCVNTLAIYTEKILIVAKNCRITIRGIRCRHIGWQIPSVKGPQILFVFISHWIYFLVCVILFFQVKFLFVYLAVLLLFCCNLIRHLRSPDKVEVLPSHVRSANQKDNKTLAGWNQKEQLYTLFHPWNLQSKYLRGCWIGIQFYQKYSNYIKVATKSRGLNLFSFTVSSTINSLLKGLWAMWNNIWAH